MLVHSLLPFLPVHTEPLQLLPEFCHVSCDLKMDPITEVLQISFWEVGAENRGAQRRGREVSNKKREGGKGERTHSSWWMMVCMLLTSFPGNGSPSTCSMDGVCDFLIFVESMTMGSLRGRRSAVLDVLYMAVVAVVDVR